MNATIRFATCYNIIRADGMVIASRLPLNIATEIQRDLLARGINASLVPSK